MTKRLQVLFDDAEMREIQRAARRKRVTVAEWVRQAVRRARNEESRPAPTEKLVALNRAMRHEFPTGEIDELLADIERGYAGKSDE
jgi:monomeric isocitrate dehydrogenase